MESIDFALAVMRLWAGIVMIAHGVNHARSLDGTSRWFESVGFKMPRLNATLSGAAEIAVGIALILGFLTAPAAAVLASIMVVAFWSIHRFAGFFVFHRPDEGYEYVATLAILGLGIAMLGPGELSLDSAIGIAESLDGWVGGAIFAGGVLMGAVQLGVMWRRPLQREDDL